MSAHPTSVDFFFDPICPWTWTTSRWLVRVAAERRFAINWHPYSLRLKAGDTTGNPYATSMEIGLRTLRVLTAIRETAGNDKAGEFYAEFGHQRFPAGLDDASPDLADILRSIAVDDSLAQTADDTSLDARIQSSMDDAHRRAGDGTGSPIIGIDGNDRAFFGPVITDIPEGVDAFRLWDAYLTLLDLPTFFEIKRDRTSDPVAPPR